jgi:predicted CXXCH cytochrome family protein
LENVCGRLFSARVPFAALWRTFYALIFGPPARKKIASMRFEKSELVIAVKKLCFQCHQKVSLELQKIEQHQPFAKANCLSCHDPHASKFSSITSADEHDLCLTCHNILNELAEEYTHSPFETRDCLSCHEPHASDYLDLKRASERILCLSCHQRIADLTRLSVQHRPFGEGCTTCHRAHASSIATLLNQAMPPLCYECHLEIKKEFAKKSQHPISTNFPCTECHRPHASNYLDLLFAFGNEVCYRCHLRIRAAYEVTAHSQIRPQAIGRITGSCLNCHLAHGSDFTPLLVIDELALCRRCHPVMFPPKDHPVGYDLVDRRTGSSLTCTSTCHWIHYWPTDALLRWIPDELCLICHSEVGISM